MDMRQRILSGLTALALVLGLCTPFGGLVPLAAAEEPGETRTGYCGAWVWDEATEEKQYGENLTWTLTGDTLTISGQGEMAGWSNSEDPPWTQYRNEIHHVVIEDGVINIGTRAFAYNSLIPMSLSDSEPDGFLIESVDLGETVQGIGEYAFANCTLLQSIEIPASVKSIFTSFIGCTGLTQVSFDPDVKLVRLHGAFSGCTGLTSVEIPASDPEYAEDGLLDFSNAFENCTSLTTVTFREGAVEVSDRMFWFCSNLTSVHLPHSVTTVFASAFEDCDRLTDIHYDGYADEWTSILDEEWYPLPASVIVHCLEDREAPSISSVTNGGYHNDNFTVQAKVTDNRPGIKVNFEVSADKGESWTPVGEKSVTGTSGTVSCTVPVNGLSEGTIAVRLTATDSSGNQSAAYTVEHILDFTPPSAPAGVTAEAKGPTEVSLTWEMPPEGEGVTSFRLYRSTDGQQFSIKAGSISSNGYTDAGLTPGQTYSYYVTAVDAAGNESTHSQTVSATTQEDKTAPSVPVITPASGSTIGPRQTIKAYTSDESSLNHVSVELKAEETSWRSLDLPLSGKSGSVSFTLDGLPSGAYSLRAKAVDAASNESAYSEIVTYILDATPPTVVNVTAQVSQADSQQVNISWTSGGEDDLAGFYLYRVSSTGSSTRIGSVSARNGQTAYTFTDKLSWNQCGQSYSYRVTATDIYGNEASVETETAVTPQAPHDTQAPMAVLTVPETAFQGDVLSFSAAGSSDDRGISSYHWDFGDGVTASGKSVTHAYTTGGTYTVTLTLSDAAGNSSSKGQTVTVTAAEDNAFVTVTVQSQTGTPLRSAQVVYDLGGANASYYTDSSGQVSFHTVDSGAVEIGAYCSGYLPGSKTVTLVHGYETEVTIRLEKAPVVTGSLTSSELTYEEIEDLGIDTSAPENQNVYEFAAEINIGGNLIQYKYYLNDAAAFVGINNPLKKVTVADSTYTISPHVVQVEEKDQAPTLKTISYVTVLRLPGTVSALKQFFEAELTVLNQAGENFSFTGCTAELSIPSGLTLIPTAESAESASTVLTAPGAEPGEIPGQSSATARWILRGDQPGEYRLQASFDGTLAGFGLPVHAEFQSEDTVEVHQADALHLEMLVSNTMLDRKLYVDLELSCDAASVNLPQITLGDYVPLEIAVREADGAETVQSEPVSTLEAGQTLVYRYSIWIQEDVPLLFECNILRGQLSAEGMDVHVTTRNITKFKAFEGSFDLTPLGVFIKTLPSLSEEDAQSFWKYLYNTSSAPSSDNMGYRILRGDLSDYDGSIEELRMEVLSLCQQLRVHLNSYVKEESERLGYLMEVITDQLWEELEDNGFTGGDDTREFLIKELLEVMRRAFLCISGLPDSIVSKLQSVIIAGKTIEDAKSSMNTMVDLVTDGLAASGIVIKSELVARYAYFTYYLNERPNYPHPGESDFQKLLRAKTLELQTKYWPSQMLDTITWITGTDSWVNHTETLQHWAETLYQLEVVALYYNEGEPEPPTEPEEPDEPGEPGEPDDPDDSDESDHPNHSGGSSGSSGNKTETERNPDGSTTTTVTKPDGSTTETTKNPDGSQEVVESKPNGTVTITVTDKSGNKTETVENPDGSIQTTVANTDGSGSVTTVSEDGTVEANARLPLKAVEEAIGKGEAVALPMPQVPVTTDRTSAPTVTVDLPANVSARVEIPVADVTPGTVAVLVKADGTEQVLRASLTTAGGVTATLSDGDTVKIVDNSKPFIDVSRTYWAAEAIDFATSRELFAGNTETTFNPGGTTNRQQVWMVLARLDGGTPASMTAARTWAVDSGISDGSDPTGTLTRQQLAAMLYRYAQSKGQGFTDQWAFQLDYPDADQVSGYAYEALCWMTMHGIISGMTDGTLNPSGTATRAQTATILQRFVETINR